VLEQLDILGEEIVPVLRRELDAKRPAHVPDGPTHAARVAAARAASANRQDDAVGSDSDQLEPVASGAGVAGSVVVGHERVGLVR
jgi:hypothetical protein